MGINVHNKEWLFETSDRFKQFGFAFHCQITFMFCE